MKHIKLLKSLIIVTPVLALASPLIILSNTGCGNPAPEREYLVDGSNWVGRTGGTLEFSVDTNNHTYTITGNNDFTANSNFTIPHSVVIDSEEYLVTTISNIAFLDCPGLTGVDLGGVTSIGIGAFEGCTGLTKINLRNVTGIDNSAFFECPLVEINVDGNNSRYELVGSSTNGFIQKINDESTLTPVCGSRGGIACGNIVIPGNVTTIGNNAFYGCTGLIGVDLGAATTIGTDAFRICANIALVNLGSVTLIGDNAFLGSPINEIYISGSNSIYKLVGTSTNGFIQKKVDVATLTPVCGSYGGIACGNITIPGTFTTIDISAFQGCKGLTGVNFGSATTIRTNAFRDCTGLTSVELNNVTTIGDNAFYQCPFEQISVGSANSTFELFGTSTNGFIKKKSDLDTLTPICGTSGGIACGAFEFSLDVIEISTNTFAQCAGITEVLFGGVTIIGSTAFVGCTRMTSIELTSVTTLGYDWCLYCVSLSSVLIGTQTYTSDDDGWDDVGPNSVCTLYAADESYANTFKSNVIGDEHAAKWIYEHF